MLDDCGLTLADSASLFQNADDAQPKKLGIIGGTFEDGSLSFYVVPDPRTIQAPTDHPAHAPLYGLSTILRLPSYLY